MPPLMLPLFPDAADALGRLSRSKIYLEIKEGRLKTVKVGRRTFITADELARYVQSLTDNARV